MHQNLRLLTALCALLYLTVAGVVPVLHAMTEGPEHTAQAHVHAPNDTGDCPAPHDTAHCPACQSAGQKLDTAPSADWRLAAGLRRVAPSSPSRQADPSARPASQPGSRAPPQLPSSA